MTAEGNTGKAIGMEASPQLVHVTALLFQPKMCSLLVIRNNDDGERHLPHFNYPQQAITSHLCCRDMSLLLAPFIQRGSLSQNVALQVVAELSPTMTENSHSMRIPNGSRLSLLNAIDEHTLTNLSLSEGLSWMPCSEFFSHLTDNVKYEFEYQYDLQTLYFFLAPCAEPAPSLNTSSSSCWHSRIINAWQWLSGVLSLRGASILEPMRRDAASSFAFLMVISTSDGIFYVKFPPGECDESRKTGVIARLLPCHTLDVLAVNEQLDCFVACPLQTISCVTLCDIKAALKRLAMVQRRAEQHVCALEEAGLANRRASYVAQQVSLCVQHPLFMAAVKKKKLCSMTVERLLSATCQRLSASQIPATLVHGDFRMDNVARRWRATHGLIDAGDKNGVVIFDWQLACISHPFCDLTDSSIVSNCDVLKDYAMVWEDCCAREEIEQDIADARIVGWLLRFYTFVRWEKQGRRRGQVPLQFTLEWCAENMVNLVEGSVKDKDGRVVSAD